MSQSERQEASVMSKRVGVLTLPQNTNIGGNLQAYALTETLKRLGHEPIFIKRRRDYDGEASAPQVDDEQEPLFSQASGISKRYPNNDFVSRHISPMTRAFQSTSQLQRNIYRYELDAIVVGSDQVWRPEYTRSALLDYFFGFLLEADTRTKRISYAASFGVDDWEFSPEQTKAAARLIKKFDAVSVREDRGVAMCEEYLEVGATHVLDPTLLLEAQHYVQTFSLDKRVAGKAKNVTAYILDRSDEKIQMLNEVATALSLDAYFADGQPAKTESTGEDAVYVSDKSVESWLAAFYNAAFIVTDSFHGVAFSILFNKPFIALGNPNRGMARFSSILSMFGLIDRLIVSVGDAKLEELLKPVDWEFVNSRLSKLRENSAGFLENALQSAPSETASFKTMLAEARGPADVAQKDSNELDIPLDFDTNKSSWTISRDAETVALRVKPGFAAVGNMVWCKFPEPLKPHARYRLTVRWSIKSNGNELKPCIRNSVSGRNHVIASIPLDESMTTLHDKVLEFVVPDNGFDQFALGGSSFPGTDRGANIAHIRILQLSAPRRPPSYAETALDLAQRDSERYARASSDGDPAGRGRARLMFSAHAIEKGLSHVHFREAFGRKALEKLARETDGWLKTEQDPEDPFFKAAISSLHVYFERHTKLGVDVSHFWRLFSPRVQALILAADDSYGGVVPASAARELIPHIETDRPFTDVVYSRRSIREFNNRPVLDTDIYQAVQIASQAPSVCNRQGPRLHQFKDQKQIHDLINLQGGFHGYKKPPCVLLVTCDLTAFTMAKERNQGYVDGGLFMMALLLGLENAGLGACPLNATMDAETEAEMRKVTGIKDSEIFVSFVAVGHYDPDVPVPRSARYPWQELIYVHDAQDSR